mmetsp:Transcript_78876/g.221305  ORF Transcript_78876/g.221305 Transcript_78876/m.221305 type:complete len:109 (+) Transcript_78876:2-328(+)
MLVRALAQAIRQQGRPKHAPALPLPDLQETRDMWRAAGVSYLRYTNEMASVLRQCLKEPYREQALQRDVIHLAEKTWANGAVQSKVTIDGLSKGFEVARGGAAAEGKK